MNHNAIAPSPSIAKEFRGFAIQTAKAIREANAKVVASFLEQGKLYKSAKDILKRKGNKEFLVENDFVASTTRKYIQFFETWGEFSVEQLQNVDFLVLLKLCSAKYKEVVQALKDTAVITQQLVDSLLKELLPPKQKAPKEITGWKQTKNGRCYNVVLHDEEVGMDIERIATVERKSRQQTIKDAIFSYKQKFAQMLEFDPVRELERVKEMGWLSDFQDDDGTWMVTVDSEKQMVTPQHLAKFLRQLERRHPTAA